MAYTRNSFSQSGETLVSTTASMNLARSNPEAGLAALQSMYGMGPSSLAFTAPRPRDADKTIAKHAARLGAARNPTRHFSNGSASSLESTTSTKAGSIDGKSKASLSDEAFMRAYGLGGVQLDGTKVGAVDTRKYDHAQLQAKFGFGAGTAGFVVPTFAPSAPKDGGPKRSLKSKLFGRR